MLHYINDNGAAFAFFAAAVSAVVTSVYVVLTGLLLRAQRESNRRVAQPVVTPTVAMTVDGLRVTARNDSAAVASGVRLYTGTGSIATVREPVAEVSLRPGDEAHFFLDHPGGEGTEPEFYKVLWGGAELLYADAFDSELIRTRIFVEEYRDPPRPSEWLMRIGVSRERHSRKALLKASRRQPPTKLDDPRETWPMWQLWVAANDPPDR